MSDETNGQTQTADGQQQPPMPSGNQTAPVAVTEQEALENSKNPERTAAYIEQLKAENAKLKEQAGQNSRQPGVLDSLRPTEGQPGNVQPQPPQGMQHSRQVSAGQFKNLSQGDVDSIQKSLTYKGEDGFDYVDTAKLNKALQDANARAERAEAAAKKANADFTRYEETQMQREAYGKYPQLDPASEKFDQRFYNNVKDKLIAQAFRGEKNLMKAAGEVAEMSQGGQTPPPASPQPQEPSPAQQKLTQKQQINASGGASRGQSNWDHNQLRQGTMHGDDNALAERLKRAGY